MTTSSKEKGFTLVELAIVMIIIGLLIGGVLKGQELINNAQVTSTITTLQSVDVAIGTFADIYNSFPGDMQNPTSRLPSCAATTPCASATVGDTGDGRITQNVGEAVLAGTESLAFWAQLAAAELISGVNINPISAPINAGDELLAADVGGAFNIGWTRGQHGDLLGLVAANETYTPRFGHYLAIQDPSVDVNTSEGYAMTASTAGRIDRKIDDGQPNSGTVVVAGSDECATEDDLTAIYNEANSRTVCVIYSRIAQ